METETTPAGRTARAIMQAARELADAYPVHDQYDALTVHHLRAVRAWRKDDQIVSLTGDQGAIDMATDVVFNAPDREGSAWHTFVNEHGAALHLECGCETQH